MTTDFQLKNIKQSSTFWSGKPRLIPMVSRVLSVLVATSENILDAVVEMIQIETVRRLNAVHNIDIEDIDCECMFGKEFRPSHNFGLLWEQSQRLVLVPIPTF